MKKILIMNVTKFFLYARKVLLITCKKHRVSMKLFLLMVLFLNIAFVNVYAIEIPSISAESYIVIDAHSGRIIASKNADKQKYMASTTKIMTAIVAIENCNNLERIVTIPKECTNIEGSSIYLVPNQKAKMIDLLYGVMLRSGNDASLAVAYFAGNKNIPKFIEDMNNKAKEVGAYNTNFVNPHGLHNSEHYTTAYDLALITKYALENEQFKEIASAKKYYNSDNNFYFINKNKVVYQYKYGTGVKIGYTKTAGRCLVASAKKDDMEIIVVVLNDGNWFNDSYKMFDFAFANYKNYNIIEENQLILTDEKNNPVFAESGFNYILTEEEKNNIKIETVRSSEHITSDTNNKVYGFYKISLNNEVIYSGKLVYK